MRAWERSNYLTAIRASLAGAIRRRSQPPPSALSAGSQRKRADRKNPPQFETPGNIVFVTLGTGMTEAFISGTQPQADTPAPPPASAPPVLPAAATPAH